MTDEQVVDRLEGIRTILRGSFASGLSDGTEQAISAAIDRFGVCECENRWNWHIEAYDDREYPFCPACGKRLEVPHDGA